jgi:hypothetical protein
LRALAIAALVAAGVVVVVAATDEGAGWARRAAMCAALAPLAGSAGALGAARIARARGEVRALEALGARPLRVVAGAVLGGALVGAVGPLVVLTGRTELDVLFPRPAEARVWVADEAGAMREASLGVRLGPGGELALLPRAAGLSSLEVPRGRLRAPVACALLVLAFAGPLGSVRTGRGPILAVAFVLLGLAMVALFQLTAAGRADPWLLVLPPCVLVACALASRYRPGPGP